MVVSTTGILLYAKYISPLYNVLQECLYCCLNVNYIEHTSEHWVMKMYFCEVSDTDLLGCFYIGYYLFLISYVTTCVSHAFA